MFYVYIHKLSSTLELCLSVQWNPVFGVLIKNIKIL